MTKSSSASPTGQITLSPSVLKRPTHSRSGTSLSSSARFSGEAAEATKDTGFENRPAGSRTGQAAVPNRCWNRYHLRLKQRLPSSYPLHLPTQRGGSRAGKGGSPRLLAPRNLAAAGIRPPQLPSQLHCRSAQRTLMFSNWAPLIQAFLHGLPDK